MIQDIYKLSPLQEGMYYSWLLDKKSTVNFEQINYKITGNFDISAIEKSFETLIQRHDVLRTSFTDEFSDQLLQIVKTKVVIPFSFKDFSNGHGFSIYEFLETDKREGFDLSSESQIRLSVFYLGNNKYDFIWSFHHIIMDGWCLSILLSEFCNILSSYTQPTVLNLPTPIKYSRYIDWLSKIDKSTSLKYWNNYLNGYNCAVEVPLRKTSSLANGYLKSKESIIISGNFYASINNLCVRNGITKNTFMQCVWGYLLSIYNNTQDVVFGSVVSGRPADIEGIESIIGLFINTIPVRIKYSPTETALEILQKVQNEAILSTSHHYLNLSEVQSQSDQGMNLINHIIVFENYPITDLIKENIEGQQQQEKVINVASINSFEQTNYDFNITISPTSSSLIIDVDYNSHIYDSGFIKNLTTHIYNVAEAFALNTDQPVNTFNCLSKQEEAELLFEFNNCKVDFSNDKTIIDLFEKQVSEVPENVAVVFKDKEFTYRELNEASNKLGFYLREKYVIKPDDLIGIKLDRSEMMIVAILGILKSGAAYVPIDFNYPQERIDYLVKDSKCKVVLDIEELQSFNNVKEKYSKENIQKINHSHDLAYVIYTSGTTGNPKGVMVEHFNVVSIFESWNKDYQLDQININLLQLASISFDVFVGDICRSILNGGKMIICSNDVKLNPQHFYELMQQQKISILEGTPSLLLPLMDYIDSQGKEYSFLKAVIFGSDVLNNQDYNNLKDKFGGTIKIINSYGVTEATIDSTFYDGYKKKLNGQTPIGKPFSNTQIYILDKELKLLPIGASGKIYISGPGVTRGYLNNPELTIQNFISNPFIEGETMYHTGDLGRWLTDGNIEFLGRNDHQVKIRGFRIELSEIETTILQFSTYLKQVIVDVKDRNSEKVLIAYIISSEIVDKIKLKFFLQQKLPAHMVPAFFMILKDLPLNPNGKIDRKKFPDLEGDYFVQRGYVPPTNDIQAKLAIIWQELLEIEKIGIKDNFFELGGHSLTVIKLINRIYKNFSVNLTISDIFFSPNIESISTIITDLNIISEKKIRKSKINI